MITVKFTDDFTARIDENLNWTAEIGENEEFLEVLNDIYDEDYLVTRLNYYPTRAEYLAHEAARDFHGFVMPLESPEEEIPEDEEERVY